MTIYLVFQRAPVRRHEIDPDLEAEHEVEQGWIRVNTVEAHSGPVAIRKAAEKLGEEAHGCTFAACAASSWCEDTVTVETEVRVKLGGSGG